LIKEGLALGLSSGDINTLDYFTYFMVDITLTEKGLKEYQRIIEMLFFYIQMLQKEGLSESLFQEIKSVTNLQFEFQSKADGLGKSINVATLLPYFPPEIINKKNYMMEEYKPQRFQEVLKFLNPSSLMVTLKNHELENLPSKEHFYGTEYENKSLDDAFIQKISDILNGKFNK
jgi:insulysin